MGTVLIAGGTGLIGQRLSEMLQEKNYQVILLSRTTSEVSKFPVFAWNPQTGYLDEEAIRHAEYIIHLAGAGIADQRWTTARKQLIIYSRVQSTMLLHQYICRYWSDSPRPAAPPGFSTAGTHPERRLKAYIAASAIGYYGHRGDQWLSEVDPPGGKGFLSESVQQWEKAIDEIEKTGLRTVRLRIGIVLSTRGGALAKMLIPFRLFSGSYFGDGQQWMSWIHIDDICRMFMAALENENWTGVYNGVAPNPVRNRDFVFTLKQALGKPAVIVSTPEPLLRLAMSEMADVLFESTKVSAEKAINAGFRFHFPELLPALNDLLLRQI